jgi:hypothetical protein
MRHHLHERNRRNRADAGSNFPAAGAPSVNYGAMAKPPLLMRAAALTCGCSSNKKRD